MFIDNIDTFDYCLMQGTGLAHCYDHLHNCLCELESMFPYLFVDDLFPLKEFKQPAMDMIQYAYRALDDIHYRLNVDMEEL